MKSVMKFLAFSLALLMVTSLCACAADNVIHGQTIVAYEQAKILDMEVDSVATLHYKLKEGCREKLNLMYFVSANSDSEDRQVDGNDLYMLDLDTGLWYFESIIDPNLLYVNDSPNFETKESALMYFYHAFDNARGEQTLLNGAAKLSYLPASEIELVNAMYASDRDNAARYFYPYETVDMKHRATEDKTIQEVLHQPAGVARGGIVTLVDAAIYLKARFSSYEEDTINLTEKPNLEICSAREIIESDRTAPAAPYNMAICVDYLISDNYEVDTLVACCADDKCYSLKTVNAIKTAKGYLFCNPLPLMGIDDMASLPQMHCSSIDEYVETIGQIPALSSVVKCIFKISDPHHIEFEYIADRDEFLVTESSCVEQIY